MDERADNVPDPYRAQDLDDYFITPERKATAVAADRIRRAASVAASPPQPVVAPPQPVVAPPRRGFSVRNIRWPRVALSMAVVVIGVGSLAGTGVRDDGRWRLAHAFLPSSIARPTPQPAEHDEPLGTPPLAPPAGGSYRFTEVQQHSAAPVTYDPCRPLRYVVNPRTAPPGGEAMLEEAIAQLEQVTGLRFVAEGTTDESPAAMRLAFQPDRYGDRWAPILVAWSNEAEVPDLTGDVAGRAGSVRIELSDGRLVYVTGMVTLDGPQFAETIARAEDGAAHMRAVLLHELAHLVGLDHVDDTGELMHPVTGRKTWFQSGDLTGLARLGAGTCVPLL